MIDKNPYEKDDVNVPNFGENEEKGSDPIFNMDTTSIVPETDSFDVEEEAESSSKVAIIVLIVFLVIFLVGTVAGLLFGISKNGEVARVTEEFDAYKVKMNSQIQEKDAEIERLNIALSQTSSSSSESTSEGESAQGTSQTASMYYLMDEGVGVRPSAGDTSKYVDFSKLPTDIQNIVFNNVNGKSVTTRKEKFAIYETKDVNGAHWGRIADGAWVCIDYGTKQ